MQQNKAFRVTLAKEKHLGICKVSFQENDFSIWQCWYNPKINSVGVWNDSCSAAVKQLSKFFLPAEACFTSLSLSFLQTIHWNREHSRSTLSVTANVALVLLSPSPLLPSMPFVFSSSAFFSYGGINPPVLLLQALHTTLPSTGMLKIKMKKGKGNNEKKKGCHSVWMPSRASLSVYREM